MTADFSTGLAVGASAAVNALSGRDPSKGKDKVAGAARDFEALLLGQILKSVHEDGGWLGSGDDDASGAAVGLGEEQLARTMAKTGGLGLSRLIEAGIRNESARTGTPSE